MIQVEENIYNSHIYCVEYNISTGEYVDDKVR